MIGPKAAEFVLHSGMGNFAWGEGWPDIFKQLLGNSLFVQDGEEHRRNRPLLLPVFQSRSGRLRLNRNEAHAQMRGPRSIRS